MHNDLISKNELVKAIREKLNWSGDEHFNGGVGLYDVLDVIDNAPTVKSFTLEDIEGVRAETIKMMENRYARLQGECKSCIHRDPEDKKCDCGGLERQGCPFPVSDDYYCKYYERGEEE